METPDLTQVFAHRLKELIPRRQVTATARKAGVAPESVHRWLGGRGGSPRLDTVQRLAGALGVSVHYLITPEKRREALDDPAPLSSVFSELRQGLDKAEEDSLSKPRPDLSVEEEKEVQEIIRDVSSYLDYRVAQMGKSREERRNSNLAKDSA